MPAFYNEFDKYPAAWLRNLSARNLIVPGVVDERSVETLAAADVRGATQAHFFAGIGTWSYALRLAGWPDDFPVWSASLPCQPFSQAGRGKGFDDERHLWPDFFKLVTECCPQCLIGEQSSSPDGIEWLDAVQADLRGIGYTCGNAVLASAWLGAPHIRHRTYWVAYSKEFRWPKGWNGRPRDERDAAWLEFERHGDAQLLADAYRLAYPATLIRLGDEGDAAAQSRWLRPEPRSASECAVDELADADGERLEGERLLVRERGSLEDLPEAPRGSETHWVGDTAGVGRGQDRLHATECGGAGREREATEHRDAGASHELADPLRARPDGVGDTGSARGGRDAGAVRRAQAEGQRRGYPDGHLGYESLNAGAAGELGDACRAGLPEQRGERGILRAAGERSAGQAAQRAGPPTAGLWGDAIWLYCRDGKYRPTQSRLEQVAPGVTRRVVHVPPLAKGVEGRVGQIKAYGNAITSLVAATFIRAFIESTKHLCE